MEITKNNFDCEEFTSYAVEEAKKFLPEKMSTEDKNFIIESFKNSAYKTGKVLSEDKSLEMNSEDKVKKYARYILEWIFKTMVALVETEFPLECRHGFVLDVGYAAFEVLNDIHVIPNISDKQIASTIEYHIIEKVKILLSKLKANMVINNTQVEKFLQHPYIEKSDKNIHFAIYGE